jgi:hypothetical protein
MQPWIELLRRLLRNAIREAEEERTRLAYLRQPGSEAEADDWSAAEEMEIVIGTGQEACPI